VQTAAAALIGILLSLPNSAWAQDSDAPTLVPFPERRLDPRIPPVPIPSDEARPKIVAAEIGKRVAPEGCVIKPVMSDEDYLKCGARPPQPESASRGSSRKSGSEPDFP
jgi:hypothetical protein